MKILSLVTLSILTLMLFNCNSSKKATQDENSLLIDNSKTKLIDYVVFQKWVAGQQQGGSGYYIEIYPVQNGKTIQLEAVYFRGQKGEITKGKKTFVANLKEELPKDIQLSSDPSDEYENSLPTDSKLPFLLNDNECVISYIDNGLVKFLKVKNLKEKPAEYMPTARPKN